MTQVIERVVLIGAVGSSALILAGLIRNKVPVVGVLCLDPAKSRNVSGFAASAMMDISKASGIPCHTFCDVNEPTAEQRIRDWRPDLLFAVGFSQIVRSNILAIPRYGAVGFHPTLLPRGRGRAPLAWLTWHGGVGAASFFQMKTGIDDGPLLIQDRFEVEPDDHAEDVGRKISAAIERALDRLCPRLLDGSWEVEEQDELHATYTGVRRPLDGLVDWNEPVEVTFARIRAASRPHPGAYTYADGRPLILWRASRGEDAAHEGVPGRILKVCPERGALIQAGNGQLWLEEIRFADDEELPNLRVGQMLGFVPQHEISKLHEEIRMLRQELELVKDRIER